MRSLRRNMKALLLLQALKEMEMEMEMFTTPLSTYVYKGMKDVSCDVTIPKLEFYVLRYPIR